MKTLIDIDRITWSKVKEYATIKDYTVSTAVQKLLLMAFKTSKRNGE